MKKLTIAALALALFLVPLSASDLIPGWDSYTGYSIGFGSEHRFNEDGTNVNRLMPEVSGFSWMMRKDPIPFAWEMDSRLLLGMTPGRELRNEDEGLPLYASFLSSAWWDIRRENGLSFMLGLGWDFRMLNVREIRADGSFLRERVHQQGINLGFRTLYDITEHFSISGNLNASWLFSEMRYAAEGDGEGNVERRTEFWWDDIISPMLSFSVWYRW